MCQELLTENWLVIMEVRIGDILGPDGDDTVAATVEKIIEGFGPLVRITVPGYLGEFDDEVIIWQCWSL